MQNMDVSLLDYNQSLPLLPENNPPSPTQSAYPLHLLARNGSASEIEALLMAGADVNQEDLLSTRPLHVAALSGNNNAVKLFIQYGADVNDNSYYGITALHLALKYQNYETAKILLNEGHADPMVGKMQYPTAFDYLANTLYQYIETYESSENRRYLPTIDKLINLVDMMGPDCVYYMPDSEGLTFEAIPLNVVLKVFASQMDPCSQKDALLKLADKVATPHADYYVNAKLLLHVFPTGGDYDLKVKDTLHPIYSEGFVGLYTTPFVGHTVNAYLEKLESHSDGDTLTYSVFSKIEKTYQFASDLTAQKTDIHACEKALEAFHNGETILLPSGWDGHFVNIILSKPQGLFACANSGQRYYEHDAGITFYKIYDPDEMDADLIYNILNNDDEMFLEYDALYQYGLFEDTHFMPGDNQEYGNCALQSHREALRGLLYIELLNEGLTPQDANNQAESYFQEWNTFLSYNTIEEHFSQNVGLSVEAYTDIFLDINLDHDNPLSHVDHAISQTLVNALLTPDYLPEFNHWLKEACGEYGKHEMQQLFEPYGLDVATLIAHPMHYHEYAVLPQHVTDPLMGL